MALFEEDTKPGAPVAHEIGCDLSRLSVEELRERVALLQAEADRLTRDIESKAASRSAADSVFRS